MPEPGPHVAEQKRDEYLERIDQAREIINRQLEPGVREALEDAVPEAITALRRAAADGNVEAAARLLDLAERRGAV